MSYMKKKYKYKYKLFFVSPTSKNKTLLNKFKNLPNISKLQHLTNESMKSLIKKTEITECGFSPAITNYNNSVNTRNKVNFNLPESYSIPTKLKDKTLKKMKSSSQSKSIADRYFFNESYIRKNFSKMGNKPEFMHRNKNRSPVSILQNIGCKERRAKKENTRKLIQDIQKGKIKAGSDLLNGRQLRRSSQIDRLLFQYINPNECFEDYVVDNKPSDKYKSFKKQLEKKKAAIEHNLIKLKVPLE